MNVATEKSIVVLARLRLKALRVSLAGRQADLNNAQNIFHQLTGLTSLRFVQNNGLSEETIKELVIMDNLAVLSVKTAHPEILEKLSKEGQELSRYLDMPARELLDLLFKKGERFHNDAAISVAYHRGLINDIQHEEDAYARLDAREQKRDA
tara:strand:+ start:5077 stop:5532 length:456 start_codon:yes stop_codon:yes gene_type:complete